ncbi:MAG: hypothetical protein H7A52_17755 [Akkermansiaceae bacterium]|nr:hypothetical protein [Akkermansiaceae bacterium]
MNDPEFPEDDHDFASHSGDGGGEESAGPARPIPVELHSFYEDRPFRSCTRCGEALEFFEEGYRVSKIHRESEVLFEYALCLPCLKNLYEESSEESRERLMRFQMERYREVSGFEECVFCDTWRPGEGRAEYGLIGICLGLDLLESNLVCGGCMEAMSALVSEQTRKSWDRFVEENFPGVPAGFEPMPIRGPVSLV